MTVIPIIHRVVKQTLRSSGANVTEKHITDVSLSALFLMKEADTLLKVPNLSYHQGRQ